jgi:glucose-6-phosphate 1-dehydrogenase
MAARIVTVIASMLLFGATGDLAGRFLLPALARLHASKHVPAHFRVLGAAREGWDDAMFQRHVARHLDDYASDVSEALRESFVRCLRYRPVDFADVDSLAAVVAAAQPFNDRGGPDGSEGKTPATDSGESTEPVVAYLALPAAVFPTAVEALDDVGLPTGSRIVLEKPFGEDLDSAIRLNELLARVVGVAGERAVFRVDHVLGMATVQNLLAVRLANRVLEPVWNSAHIEEVELLWEETLGLEGRANFYDRTGALKDVIQNHLLQVLCLVAMEPPVSLGERDLRDRKLDVLRSVRPLTPTEVVERTRRARYTAGRLSDTGGADGSVVPGYAKEEGIDPQRGTETFAEVTLEVENWRWSGTRFVLRTGKAMADRRKQVVVRFRAVPHLPIGEDVQPPAANELRIGLDGPYDLTLALTGTASGPPTRLAPLPLTAQLAGPELPAYSRVLMDVLSGDSALSIRGDEAEQAWRILTPVMEAWARGRVPLLEYPAGSGGPPKNRKGHRQPLDHAAGQHR